MKKRICILSVASLFFVGSALASGWRIPEQSVDSTAKAGANIASAQKADAAYFNPANMAWMEDNWHLQANATWIHLAAIDYEDARTSTYDGESEEEDFLLPTGFMVSPDYNGVRVGFSITAPYGLAKRWETPMQKATAEEFALTVIEANPTLSYTFCDYFSFAAGVRMLYADATVKSDASLIGTTVSRSMEGDTIEWGWNVAASLHPSEELNISATYRSHVDLEFEDKAHLNLMGTLLSLDTEVSVPAPAVLALSLAYDITEDLTVELTWDRTFWSEYDELDFDFNPAVAGNPFEAAVVRDWEDTNAFRIGVTYQVNDIVSVMAGFGYDENPAPEERLGYELPDSDAWLYSLGMQYALHDDLDIGIATLYDYKEERTVDADPTSSVYGEFSNASALLVTVGLNYRF